MAQIAEPQPPVIENKQEALCPFYGSSSGCPYLNNCEFSHSNPNSIPLCPQYQTLSGCPNPSSCYYRHALTPLTSDQIYKLTKKHKISGKIHYTRVIKGTAVYRVIIIINQVLWYGIHFIIEDFRARKIHYQKYTSIYFWPDAVLVSELIGNILINAQSPGKYLSYLKNLIDGDTEPGNDPNNKKNEKLIHYRDILSSIGNNYQNIPKPINPHLVGNLSRVPWVDFKLLPLMPEVYDYPDIMLQAGDLVRIWRPKKFVYHCGIYLGNAKIIHISNGVQGDQGMNWRISGLFQSGSSAANNKQYYDYGKKIRDKKREAVKMDKSDGEFVKIEYDNDDDDMDLVDDDEEDECKAIILETKDIIGEKEPDEKQDKEIELLYQDINEFEQKENMNEIEMEHARRARICEWKEFISGSRRKDLELGFFIFPWRTTKEIVYTAQFLTEIHYMKGKYSVYKNNCEHFALYCCTGLRYSPQSNTLEKVIKITSKIGNIAGNIFNKATSFRKANKDKDKDKDNDNDTESENRKNHPVIQDKELDDGGDDELEKILLNDGEDKKSKKIKTKAKKVSVAVAVVPEFDMIDTIDENKDNNNNNNYNNDLGDNMLIVDEYANDEEDVLAESIIIEQNEDINKYESNMKNDLSDMTPGGLTQSEVLNAKKYYNQHKWHV